MTSKFLFLSRVPALSVAITVFASSMAAAQTPASTPTAGETAQTRLLGLPAQGPMASPVDVTRAVGTEVRVTSTNGSEQIGTLVSLSASEVVLRASNGDSVVPLGQVQKVERTSRRVEKWAGIGVLVGLGVGALAGMTWCLEGECLGPAWFFVLGGGIGGGVGAGVGMGMNRASADRDVIYDAGRTTVQVAPILSPRQAGLAMAVRW